MSTSIEERLRAHFADRASRETLPGPEADTALQRAREGGGAVVHGLPGASRRPAPRRRVLLLAAAVIVVVAAVAGAVVLNRGEPSDVSTDGDTPTTVPEPEPEVRQEPSTTVPTTVPESTTPTTTQPAAGTTPTGPIVSADGVLGSWSGSAWVPWDTVSALPLGLSFRRVALDQPVASVVGAREVRACSVPEVPSIDVGLPPSQGLYGVSGVAVAGVGDPRPRAVEVLDPANPEYRAAAAEVVAGLGIDDPLPVLGQVVRGDLDGDGAAEVLVVAERLSDDEGQLGRAGDYSVAFLRRPAGGRVETTVVARSLADPRPDYTPFVEAFRVGAIADLNGDGRMEVVLGRAYYEGSSTDVYELQGGAPVEVLSAGCGV